MSVRHALLALLGAVLGTAAGYVTCVGWRLAGQAPSAMARQPIE